MALFPLSLSLTPGRAQTHLPTMALFCSSPEFRRSSQNRRPARRFASLVAPFYLHWQGVEKTRRAQFSFVLLPLVCFHGWAKCAGIDFVLSVHRSSASVVADFHGLRPFFPLGVKNGIRVVSLSDATFVHCATLCCQPRVVLFEPFFFPLLSLYLLPLPPPLPTPPLLRLLFSSPFSPPFSFPLSLCPPPLPFSFPFFFILFFFPPILSLFSGSFSSFFLLPTSALFLSFYLCDVFCAFVLHDSHWIFITTLLEPYEHRFLSSCCIC